MLYVLHVLSFVVLILFWFDNDFGLRGKLIATVICLALVGLSFVQPLLAGVGICTYGLALYFVMFPSGKFGS